MGDAKIEIFNAYGLLRPMSEHSPEAIAAMTPERRERFEQLRTAALEQEAGLAAVSASAHLVRECIEDHEDAKKELARVRPKLQFMDLWKQDVRGPQ